LTIEVCRDLAANIGISFHTPEEFFLNAQVEPYEHTFEPARHLEALKPPNAALNYTPESPATVPFTKTSPQELVIFCGSPGAGKSTFFWDVLQPLGYERVNQDILKTVRTPYHSITTITLSPATMSSQSIPPAYVLLTRRVSS
jgi:bifunctional polynucleotide phosphatase/kinase